MAIQPTDMINKILNQIVWTVGNQKVDIAVRTQEIVKLLKVLVHENSNKKTLELQARKIGFIQDQQLKGLTELFLQVKSSTGLRNAVLNFINHPDTLLSDLYELNNKQPPACLTSYHEEAFQAHEQTIARHIAQAQRVLAAIDIQSSVSSSDYIFHFENLGIEISIPHGFKAYRDIEWKPCDKFVQGIMEKGPVSVKWQGWMGSGQFRKDLPISESAYRRIISHTSNNPFFKQGYLLNIKHPISGKPLIIDAHGMSQDIENGKATLVEFGPVMWQGEDVTEAFWERLDEMTAPLVPTSNNRSPVINFPGVASTSIQNAPNRDDLKTFLGAVEICDRRISSEYAFSFYLDEKWKVEKARTIRDKHTNSYGRQPWQKEGDGWRFFIHHNDSNYQSRDWVLADYECLFGLEGSAHEQEVLHYNYIVKFTSRPLLEKAIHILIDGGIVHPLQITARGLELYILDFINFDKLNTPEAQQARLENSNLALVESPDKPVRKRPIAMKSGSDLKEFISLVCPQGLIQIRDEGNKIRIEMLPRNNLSDRGMFQGLIKSAFELMSNIVAWENISCEVYDGPSLILDKNQAEAFIAAILKQEKLVIYLKSRFIAAALEVKQEDGADHNTLAIIQREEQGIVLAHQQIVAGATATKELLKAAQEGDDDRINGLINRGGNATWVLQELIAFDKRDRTPKTSTCTILLRSAMRTNPNETEIFQKMLHNLIFMENSLPIILVFKENGVNIDPQQEGLSNVFVVACVQLKLPLITHFLKEIETLEPRLVRQTLEEGLNCLRTFNTEVSDQHPAVSFLLNHLK